MLLRTVVDSRVALLMPHSLYLSHLHAIALHFPSAPQLGEQHTATNAIDPKIAAQQEKEHKKLEKQVHNDEKKENKMLHSVEKQSKHQVKAEAKAAKVSEFRRCFSSRLAPATSLLLLRLVALYKF